MRRYIRQKQPGGVYFFTVVTHERRPLLAGDTNVGFLRAAFQWVKHKHPFQIQAIVILPDHIHCIWRLPAGDNDFPLRWAQIKRRFSLSVDVGVTQNASRRKKREREVWQRRYWEHLIRDERDWRSHMDYIHYNPVRHGYVDRVNDWPYSSFAHWVKKGWYEPDWGNKDIPSVVLDMALE
jgi:putative transposase